MSLSIKDRLELASKATSVKTERLKERLSDHQVERGIVTTHLRIVLNELLQPLHENFYPYLLEAEPREGVDGDSEGSVSGTGLTDEAEEERRGVEEAPLPPDRVTHDEHVFMVEEAPVVAWQYLGEEYSAWIESLHMGTENALVPAGLCTALRPWQLTGMSKMIRLAESTYRGAILGDEMGLGKTLTTICACERLKHYPGSFNLIVTPKACVYQWRDELYWNFEPESRPRVLILDNPRTTVNELLDQHIEYVICSFGFVRSRWRERIRVIKAFLNLPSGTVSDAEEAKPYLKNRSTFKTRLTSSLHSDVYDQLGLPIRCLVIDEAHLIKNERSETYRSIRGIDARFVFSLTGTMMVNRWHDVFGPLSLLRNHPFRTRKSFKKAFTRRDSKSMIAKPTQSKENRLVKFLQGVVIARPASLLQLEGLEVDDKDFWIGDLQLVAVVSHLVQLFYDALAQPGSSNFVRGAKTLPEKAVLYATLAQQLAANPEMLGPSDRSWFEDLKKEAVAHIDDFVKANPALDPKSNEFYNSVILHINKFYRYDHKGKDSQESPNESLVDSDGSESEDEAYEDSQGGDSRLLRPEDLQMRDPNARKEFLVRMQEMSDAELLSPRIRALLQHIVAVHRQYPGEKILVFSRFLKFLDLGAKALERKHPDIKFLRFDGTVKGPARKACISQFEQHQGSMVLLITAGCGGAGLNLSAASHVIQCEPWWREADELQAFGRAFRMGQTKKVYVRRLYGKDARIDGVLRDLNSRKAQHNDRIMALLRREDDDPPTIPQQYRGRSGE